MDKNTERPAMAAQMEAGTLMHEFLEKVSDLGPDFHAVCAIAQDGEDGAISGGNGGDFTSTMELHVVLLRAMMISYGVGPGSVRECMQYIADQVVDYIDSADWQMAEGQRNLPLS